MGTLHEPGPLPPELADAWALVGARLGAIGNRACWFAEIGSTNDQALAMASRGAAEGCLVGADAQVAGRGRHGRTWTSPPLSGLYLSIVLRPPAHAVALLTLAVGVGVAEGLERASGLVGHLKWPNDVYVPAARPRKIAGILTEAGAIAGVVEHVVVGIGVNVRRTAWPVELATRATTIEDELGRTVDRGLVAAEVCAGVWHWYQVLARGDRAQVLDAWRRRGADLLGRRVEWEHAGTSQYGIARDVDQSGALVVETDRGVVAVTAGEVRWLI